MKTMNGLARAVVVAMCAGVWACGASANDDAGTTDAADAADGTASAMDGATVDGGNGGDGGDGSVATVDCTGVTGYAATVACATNAFVATLTDAQRSSTVYAFTDSAAKTRWSNLPGVARSGIQFRSMSTASQTAAVAVARAALSDQGFDDFTGIRAADDYLGTMTGVGGGGDGGAMPGGDGGMGPPGDGFMGPGGDGAAMPGSDGGATAGATYSSLNYYVAVFGTPSDTGTWMLAIGGHHMAYNLTFQNGALAPTPNHLGVEPKASFTLNGESYAPLADDGAAIVAAFTDLTPDQLASGYLAGQTFDDVVLGPVEYGTGTLANVTFPSGTARTGVQVSSLTATQQAAVTAAIAQWVRDYPSTVADPLMTAYTSADAYADTYIAWGGTLAAGVDPDVAGTYLRIDGPRVWIEVACQSGVVIRGLTHYHTIFRDKAQQYGGAL